MTLWSLMDGYNHFTRICCLHLQDLSSNSEITKLKKLLLLKTYSSPRNRPWSHGGGVEVQLHSILTWALDGVGVQRHAPATLTLSRALVPIGGGWGHWMGFGEEKIPCPHQGSKPWLSLKYVHWVSSILCLVDRVSLYNLVNKANLVHNFS